MTEITVIEAANLFTTSHKLAYYKVVGKTKKVKSLIKELKAIIDDVKETCDKIASVHGAENIKNTLNYDTSKLSADVKEQFNEYYNNAISQTHNLTETNFLTESELTLMLADSDANFSEDELLGKYFLVTSE